MQLEFYWDSAGDPRARCKGIARVVAGFLESDLQDSAEAAREVLSAVDDVESGRLPSWERTGNAYTLTLSAEGTEILDEMDDEAEPYPLSLSEIREVVADWAAFLEEGRRK
jgi:uncharacterized protein YacL (UPF0231 family)